MNEGDSWMKLLKELNIKMKILNENKTLNENKQEMDFATYRQAYSSQRVFRD